MYTVTKNTKLISYVLMAIGLVAIVFGFTNDAHRAWPSLMVNNYETRTFWTFGAYAFF